MVAIRRMPLALFFSLFFMLLVPSKGPAQTECVVPGFVMERDGVQTTVAVGADDYLEWIACKPLVVGQRTFAAVLARAKLPGVRTGHDLGSGWRAAFVTAGGVRTFLNAPFAGICESGCSFHWSEDGEQVSLSLNAHTVSTGEVITIEPPELIPVY